MSDGDLRREELQAELRGLRRRVEELESENACLRKQRLGGDEEPLAKTFDAVDALSLLLGPELRETEEDYFAVVQTASEAICITQDGLLKFVNPAGTQLTGYSKEELLSKPFSALTHPEDLEDLARIYLMRLQGEYVPLGHRFRIIGKDGEVKWVESSSASITWKGRPAVLSMIRDVNEQVQAEELMRQAHEELDRRVQDRTAELETINDRLMREISERKQAQLLVRESADRFRKLMDKSPMGISVVDMNGQVIYLNEKFTRSFGYTLRNIPTLEHWWQRAYPDPERAELVRSEWLSATREAGEKCTEAEPIERDVRCQDGTIRAIDFRKTVIDKWVIHTFHDVTETKRQKEALRESEQMFRLLSEQSLMSVAILQDGVYKYTNQAMSDLCEYSPEEIATWGPEEFLAVAHPDDRSLVMEQARMKQQGDARQKTHYAFRIITKSGHTKSDPYPHLTPS